MKNMLAGKRPHVLLALQLFHADRTQARIFAVCLLPMVQCPPAIELDEREVFVDVDAGEDCSSSEVVEGAEESFFALLSVDSISYGDCCPKVD
jgi:hypothetical protein